MLSNGQRRGPVPWGEHASVHEGIEVGKRVEQGSGVVAWSADRADGTTAPAGERVTPLPRSHRKPGAEGNGSADWLGRGLRKLYQETAAEPIPDKFRELLERLDEQDLEASNEEREERETSGSSKAGE
jgi:hypothetical protein